MFNFVLQYDTTQMLTGLGLAALIGAAAWRLGALTLDGAIAATLVGGITFGLGGVPAAVLLIAFFASSSLLSRAFASKKKAMAANFAKGGQRDLAQVAANGGMGVLALVAGTAGWVSAPVAWTAFAAALAAVNADTWATELGVLSATKPRLITSGEQVPYGTSGGITWLGSGVAFAAAVLIGVLIWVMFPVLGFGAVLVISVAGLLGSFVDSYLGATVQAIYYCPKCKKETERHPLHSCGTQTKLKRGWKWLSNDWVNFLSAVAGALLASGAAISLL